MCNYTKTKNSQPKTINLPHFEGHFDGKFSTPTFNITTKLDSKDLSYNKIIKTYLEEDTIVSHSYLSEKQWVDTDMRSKLEAEKFFCAAKIKAYAEQKICRTMKRG